MIRLIMIIVVLLIVLLLTVGGLIYFKVVPDFTGMILPPTKTVASAASAVPAEPVVVDPELYDITPVTVPVIRDGQLTGSVYVAFRLEMVPGKQKVVDDHLQQLHDVYIRALYRELAAEFNERETPNIPAIKAYLKELTEKVVGPGVIKDVIIQSAFVR